VTRRGPGARAIAAAGALVCAIVAVALVPGAPQLRRALRDGFGPEGGADGRSARLLRQLGLDADTGGWSVRPEDAPSSRALDPAALAPGQWLVSVAVPEESLRDPDHGILANPERHGRAWERVAWVSLYDGRRLVMATRAGLRMHGGSGRAGRRESFRVIFRPSFGTPHLPVDGPLATRLKPPDRFVVRRHQVMPQAQPIAFAIARRVGSVAPSAVSVRFVLNGQLRPEPYELTEHVSTGGWGRSYFGHGDYQFHLLRSQNASADTQAYDRLVQWVRSTPAPLRLTAVAEHLDVDGYLAHLVALMYCGTEDWAQGAVVRDQRARRPVWFWVHWDMDQSFQRHFPEAWMSRSATLFTHPSRPTERGDLRSRLFKRLLREDPAFAPALAAASATALNHRLTPEFLRGLVREAEPLSVSSPPFGGFNLQAFFDRRGDVVFDEIAKVLAVPRPHVVDIRAPDGARLRVDGHDHGATYRGRYFDGQTVSVEATDGGGTPLVRWTVNGTPADGSRLAFAARRDTVIRAGGSE
jgi:hypothetical protein